MAGLINQPSTIQQPPTIQNPLLAKAEAKVEASVGQGQTRADYLKVVVAGMRAALANGPQGMMAKLKGRPDPVHDCALGAVNLVIYMRHLATGTMPMRSIVPAAMTLMLQALDFADHTGIVKVGAPELDRATHIFTNAIFKALGITPQMLSQAAGMVHGVTQNPEQLAAVKQQLPQPQQGEA
jgi:hypothetical protein